MLGGDRPFMVSTAIDTSSMSQFSGRQPDGFEKIRGSYGKPTPRIGNRNATGLGGRVTSISRTLYPYQQVDQVSSIHYGVPFTIPNDSHQRNTGYSSVSRLSQRDGHRSCTETSGSHQSSEGSVKSVRYVYQCK